MDAMTDPVLALAVPFITAKEGFRSHPYQDQAGVWTYGHGFAFQPDGQRVTADTSPITEAASHARLVRLVSETAAKVDQMVHRPMTAGQHAALTSFAFNCGTGALRTSTLLRLFESGDIQGAADQFRAWIYAGGKVSRGLQQRREEERAMFLGLGAGTAAPSHEISADDLNARELQRVKGTA